MAAVGEPHTGEAGIVAQQTPEHGDPAAVVGGRSQLFGTISDQSGLQVEAEATLPAQKAAVVRGIEPAGGIAQLAQGHTIDAKQACGIVRITLVNPKPVVLRLDPHDQGVAQQLGAIAAAALLTGEAAIDGKPAQVGMVGAPTEDPQGETGGGTRGLRHLQILLRGGGFRQLRGRGHHEDQRWGHGDSWGVKAMGVEGGSHQVRDPPSL